MNTIEILTAQLEFNRSRTLATLDEIAGLPLPAAALGWRADPDRAPLGWQLMHIAVTEELFATERTQGTPARDPDLIDRFKGGSTPDNDTPTVEEIREHLASSRQHLLETYAQFDESDLDRIPAPLQERGWSLGKVLQVMAWHEPHHHGQVHATFNLWKAAQQRQAES